MITVPPYHEYGLAPRRTRGIRTKGMLQGDLVIRTFDISGLYKTFIYRNNGCTSWTDIF